MVSGVPHGSILGPMLSILYTSCLEECFTVCKHYFYADDTTRVTLLEPTFKI